MPRSVQIPAYKLHKPSGQARVIIHGRHVYLGLFDSPASREKYAQQMAELFQRVAESALAVPAEFGRYPDLSVNEILLEYDKFAVGYYVKDGEPYTSPINVSKTFNSVFNNFSLQSMPRAKRVVATTRLQLRLGLAICLSRQASS